MPISCNNYAGKASFLSVGLGSKSCLFKHVCVTIFLKKHCWRRSFSLSELICGKFKTQNSQRESHLAGVKGMSDDGGKSPDCMPEGVASLTFLAGKLSVVS